MHAGIAQGTSTACKRVGRQYKRGGWWSQAGSQAFRQCVLDVRTAAAADEHTSGASTLTWSTLRTPLYLPLLVVLTQSAGTSLHAA